MKASDKPQICGLIWALYDTFPPRTNCESLGAVDRCHFTCSAWSRFILQLVSRLCFRSNVSVTALTIKDPRVYITPRVSAKNWDSGLGCTSVCSQSSASWVKRVISGCTQVQHIHTIDKQRWEFGLCSAFEHRESLLELGSGVLCLCSQHILEQWEASSSPASHVLSGLHSLCVWPLEDSSMPCAPPGFWARMSTQ